MCILLCTACGKKAELHEEPDVQPVEVTETSSEEDEINENEEFTNTDTFNDYVEVEYEPDEYVAIEDDKPDYSGIYMDLYGTQIAYEYCKLVKQPKGDYYCEIYVYRSFSLDSKAVYKSDGQLEILEDEYGNSGSVRIQGNTAYVTICHEDGTTDEKEFVASYSGYPDLKNYVGTYSYTTDDGQKYLIGVHYNDNYEPYISVFNEDDMTSFYFYHFPPEFNIYEIDGKLYAEVNAMFTGPDDEFENYIIGYYGNHYMIIDNSDDKSKIYYKECQPMVMH
jgi:hypothetical protein